MSQSNLATFRSISPNCTKPRAGRIRGISIHCTAGSEKHTARQIVSLPRFTTYDAKYGASCHYAVGGDGSIAQGCLEENRAWCTSSRIDHEVVTIEVASNVTGTVVTQAALEALIRLCADICRRNGIDRLRWDGSDNAKKILQAFAAGAWWQTANMVPHRYFRPDKACPGEFLFSRYGLIADRVNALLGASEAPQDQEGKMDIQKFIDDLTPAQAFQIMQKAQQHAGSLPEPAWSVEEGSWSRAAGAGLTDGKRPEAYCKRDEVASMIIRAGVDNVRPEIDALRRQIFDVNTD